MKENEMILVSKEKIIDLVAHTFAAHTDWTGTRMETMNECRTILELSERMWDFLNKK